MRARAGSAAAGTTPAAVDHVLHAALQANAERATAPLNTAARCVRCLARRRLAEPAAPQMCTGRLSAWSKYGPMLRIEAPPPISQIASACKWRRCDSMKCSVRFNLAHQLVGRLGHRVGDRLLRSAGSASGSGCGCDNALRIHQVLGFVERDVEHSHDSSSTSRTRSREAAGCTAAGRRPRRTASCSNIPNRRPKPAARCQSARPAPRRGPSPAARRRSPSNSSPLCRQSRHSCEIHGRDAASTLTLNASVLFSRAAGFHFPEVEFHRTCCSAHSSASSSADHRPPLLVAARRHVQAPQLAHVHRQRANRIAARESAALQRGANLLGAT